MNDPKIQFVLNYFTRVLNLKKQLEVNYSENESKDSKIWIKNGAGNFFNQEKVYEVDQVSWKKWRGQDLPVLFADEIEKPWFEVENGQVKVQYDLMSSAFYFLSGWDEVYRPVRDAYDRFPYSAGIIARLNIIGLPVVSWYADIIKEAIKYSEYSYELISKNKDPKFHIALTHDIDSLYSGWLQDGWAYIKKGSPQKLVNIISDKVQGYDSWFNLDNISRWETTLDVGASYYFLPQKDRKPGNIPQADYQFNDLNLRNVVKNKLIGRFECGVHGSVGSSRSVDQLQKDMQQIENLTGRQPDGGRFHF